METWVSVGLALRMGVLGHEKVASQRNPLCATAKSALGFKNINSVSLDYYTSDPPGTPCCYVNSHVNSLAPSPHAN